MPTPSSTRSDFQADRAAASSKIMKTIRVGSIVLLSASLACQQHGDAVAQPGGIVPEQSASTTASVIAAKESAATRIVRVPTPDTLRGLYVNRWAALGSKLNRLIE